jgi:hypothetical protein
LSAIISAASSSPNRFGEFFRELKLFTQAVLVFNGSTYCRENPPMQDHLHMNTSEVELGRNSS